MKLVIVESPTKSKTIEKYLGKEYKVVASGGHIRDLPEKSLGINIQDNFKPEYVIAQTKTATIKSIKDLAKKSSEIYLATDPDREGEAISWHLAQVLGLSEKEKNRIVFNEITAKAVNAAIKTPRSINVTLVDAQQARRVLDRLVGYKVSPIICRKIQNKLSAGRVQSAALKFVVDREKEITTFKPEEYWTVLAELSPISSTASFRASLVNFNGKKIKPSSKEEVDTILSQINGKDFIVSKIKESTVKTHAPAPFTTSTMQQDASSKLAMASTLTMRVAQQLYEGINLGELGQTALVTYIRTDSTRISEDAQLDALGFIEKLFGSDYVPKKPNIYKSKKDAQDAHEAIRPINLEITPKSVKDILDRNQYRLYRMIYERFVASQMSEAVYNSTIIDIDANKYTFRSNFKRLLFKGFTAVYEIEKNTDRDEDKEGSDILDLPQISEGEKLKLIEITTEQKFTKPPARFTDASLIKLLEEKGIGRPSTFATILGVLLKREYTTKDGKYIVPSEVAFLVIEFLEKHFNEIVDAAFTAELEEKLDNIENEGKSWQDIIADFYVDFEKQIKVASVSSVETDESCPLCGHILVVKNSKNGKFIACSNYPECKYIKQEPQEVSEEICEKCGSNMIIKSGRYGKYLACPKYPDCKNIKSLKKLEVVESDQVCEKCGNKMLIKDGKYGKYLACSNYPDCKNIISMEKAVAVCPDCGKDVIARKSKKGKVFYGCKGYPDCKFVSWDIPTDKKCPKCESYTVYKMNKDIKNVKCSNADCDYIEEVTN